jgi:hypothetical protein
LDLPPAGNDIQPTTPNQRVGAEFLRSLTNRSVATAKFLREFRASLPQAGMFQIQDQAVAQALYQNQLE